MMNGNDEKPAIEMNMETCNWRYRDEHEDLQLAKGNQPIHSKLRIACVVVSG